MPKAKIDNQTFLELLHRSGLVTRAQLDAALTPFPSNERPKNIARVLVKQGLLTRFQAELLLAGRSGGFVLGQYRILDQLGEGGMGRVFKAQHITMGRTVALKVLAPRHTKTPKARKLFLREVRAAGKLMHPNIVTAHDANMVKGRHYLVMEYIDGPSLDQLVREGGPLPVGLACDIVRQVGTGLQYAFEQGMVHRDIKPSNVLLQRTAATLTSGYLAKILDFGLAWVADAAEEADAETSGGRNVILGTPDFLSPEQARNQHAVDIRSDLYSLGCTFYFLLAGRVPFPGGTNLNKLVRHTKEEPTPLEELRPDVPQEVTDIISCLMAKEPAHRFQTPADLVEDLGPLAAPIPLGWPPAMGVPVNVPDTVDVTRNGGTSSFLMEGKGIANSAPKEASPADSDLEVETEPTPQDRGWNRTTVWVLGATAGALIGAAAMAGAFLWMQ